MNVFLRVLLGGAAVVVGTGEGSIPPGVNPGHTGLTAGTYDVVLNGDPVTYLGEQVVLTIT